MSVFPDACDVSDSQTVLGLGLRRRKSLSDQLFLILHVVRGKKKNETRNTVIRQDLLKRESLNCIFNSIRGTAREGKRREEKRREKRREATREEKR